MKMNKFLMMSAIALTMTGFGIYKADAATDALDTEAIIVEAMTVVCGQSLDFGEIGSDADGGTVAVSAAGVATPTGVIILAGTPTQGICAVTGGNSFDYGITLTANPLMLGGVTGPDDMPLSALVITNANGNIAGAGPYTATLDATGDDSLSIGGTLTLAANQVAGSYTGTVDVVVDYQ